MRDMVIWLHLCIDVYHENTIKTVNAFLLNDYTDWIVVKTPSGLR
jgi:hypothetical protein